LKRLILALAFLIPVTIHSEPVPEVSFSGKDLRCLELNIHFEARGEPILGQKAVALVTVNRAKSGKFPNDICKVVYQKFQFSWTHTHPNHKHVKVDPKITLLAIETLSNKYKDFTRGALYFHNTSVESFNRREVTRIGNHIFYI
jgi:N-acetylmuramoyl-L-alanine amidase